MFAKRTRRRKGEAGKTRGEHMHKPRNARVRLFSLSFSFPPWGLLVADPHDVDD